MAASAGGRDRTRVTPVSSGRRGSAISYRASPGGLCATMNRRYHSSGAYGAPQMEQYHDLAPLNSPTSPVSLRPGARGPCNDDGVPHYCDRRPSAGALPQSRRSGRGARRRSADRCPAANDAGAGSRQRGIVLSGDPVDDAAMRRRFLAAFRDKYQIVPDGEDQAVLVVGEERWPFPIRLVRLNSMRSSPSRKLSTAASAATR